MSNQIVPPEELIERDGKVIRFKGLYDSKRPGESVEVLDHSESFEQANAAGDLRQLATPEEACIEGQRIAMLMRRIQGIA